MSPAPTSRKWPQPPPRIQELLRRGAELVLHVPEEWLSELDQAGRTRDSAMDDDPVLVAAARRANRGSIAQWAKANIEHPGAPVPAFMSTDMISNAREVARHGDEELLFKTVRSIHNVAWQRWMQIAFGLTSDPHDLQALLDVSARSIAAFIDANTDQLAAVMKAERIERQRGTYADRKDLVAQIIEGANVPLPLASQKLGYALDQAHHAAIIWSEEADAELSHLEAMAEALARHAGARQSLVVIVNAATLWVWTHGAQPIDLSALQQVALTLPGVRTAVGSSGPGIEGFRRGHLDALATQRLMGRLNAKASAVRFDQIRLVSLLMENTEAGQRFISHTLGKLATAAPSLRTALYTFLSTGCNATVTAERLRTHRNTLLRRLARAEELLPRPLDGNRVHVAAALEALSWSGDAQAERAR